jgi:regulator of RNase E activity RraA
MLNLSLFSELSPTDYANVLKRDHFMDFGIKALWPNTPRVCGPAFTVQLAPGDHLMLHMAIHQAPEGSIIVASGCGNDLAAAGGNVCAVAKQRGIAGFIVDGVVRDIAEIRENQFPVFARGVFPVPGNKTFISPLETPIICGGVNVESGDIIVADEEGIVVIPKQRSEEIYSLVKAKFDAEQSMTLEQWQQHHIKRITSAYNKQLT